MNFLTFILPLILSVLTFTILMYYIQKSYFKPEYSVNKTAQIISTELQYHNQSIYKAFEFYIKITLAIAGAIGIASVSKEYNDLNINLVISFLGNLLFTITFLFGIIYLSHQKAKISRWKSKFGFWDPLLWSECWLFSLTISLACLVKLNLIPNLLNNL